jgi:hypothetical protein
MRTIRLLVSALLFSAITSAGAAPPLPPPVNLAEQVALLKAQVAALQAQVAALQANTVLGLDGRLRLDNSSGQPTARFEGVNVQVVNGVGTTDSVNGLGNLIIGYDESRNSFASPHCSDGQYADEANCVNAGKVWAINHKSGSHYLVIGEQHNYSQYAGMVVGLTNTSNRRYATVTGGRGNIASGDGSSVTGGRGNTASAKDSSVTGGRGNTAGADASSVTGGWSNIASGGASSVSGGLNNAASGEGSTATGGKTNTASGSFSSVSGGHGCTETRVFGWSIGDTSEGTFGCVPGVTNP